MEFVKQYTVNPAHIDVQGIMDGLYYPFYMETCRHDFIREVLGFDLEEQAHKGVFMVLSQYTIKYLRSLKKDDAFTVNCVLYADKAGAPRLHFKQDIIMNGKIMTSATFTGTCVPATGGRPYLPEAIKSLLVDAPVLEV
ncbi:acyl-CoA thioester hydrolase [Chitinophaga costaii]|uniref:Acyl-CoA thioester hydrolase n=1 Tax=Chitinophaga costaii TaxID=1335309 RepID=A0A1C4EVB1_9BACT|nr:thioesterase family protein [Chitinophaga costaii]PUZ21628.1 thioesterase [Chitinophaga costaii]SCC47471.1 acyl-CoA thioester hydrolase [Chitinophaga costaii]